MLNLIIVVVVVLLLLAVPIAIYNNLVALRNRYKNSYAQIAVQLQRRHDLIPNLVQTAKGYIAHERGTLEAVTQARNQAVAANQAAAAGPGDPATMQKLSAAETTLGGALSRLLAVAEAYPDLKANQNMMLLMEELTSTENKVAFARQAFNDAVMSYNTSLQSFPNNMLAGLFGFTEAASFHADDAAAAVAPRVAF